MSEPEKIRDWVDEQHLDAKAAEIFAGFASDSGQKRSAAWLQGFADGLRLASMRAWRLSPPPELLELTDSPEVPGP